jgi:hypothetical protein
MAAHEYAFTLTPGSSSRTRSLAIACAAIAAVCVLSSTVVMRELAGTPTARAAAPTTVQAATAATARTWALEPRWWSGQISQIKLQAPKVRDSELTFTKGYQLSLAARQATQPAAQPASPSTQIAAGPIGDSQYGRTATVRKPTTTVAHTEMPTVRRINAAPADSPADPFARFDVGSRALAYDEQRPRDRGVAAYRSAPSRGLFGTLY